MKKYVTVSLFIFWGITVAVIVAGLISLNKNNKTIVGSNTNGVEQIGNITGVSAGANNLVLSSTELAKHNSGQSCWLLISGKIYDVTAFINSHPGGDRTILSSCGTDATVAFGTRGGTGSHSSSANAMLGDYYIGNLNQTVTTNPANRANRPVVNPNPTTPTSRGDDD